MRIDLYLCLPDTLTMTERDRITDAVCLAMTDLMTTHGGNVQTAIVPASWLEGGAGERLPLLPAGGRYHQTNSWRVPSAPTGKTARRLAPAVVVPDDDTTVCPGDAEGRHWPEAFDGGVVKCFQCGRRWTGNDAARAWNAAGPTHRGKRP